ncbi:MAG: DUF4199 domain-containing protein [Bacteroidetes bacterium]|nr:DUF4199 domain-containing protein [Bacteroidota bacterium]
MKRNILVFGGIAGLIVSIWVVCLAFVGHTNDYGELIGYASMIIAFIFILVGVKNYRDKYNQGVISFGKAFRVGLGIALVASTIYVIVWLIEYYCFIPDFMDKYAESMIKKATASGATKEVLDKKISEINGMKELYKNPLMVIGFTYLEILPVGVIIALISALVLKRKTAKPAVALAG